MSLLPVFERIQEIGIFGSSPYLGPGVNLVHLLAMVLFAGAVLVVDLRLLGVGLTEQPLRQVALGAQPWLLVGFWGLVLTGVPAFMATAARQYVNWVFWLKMALLLFGVILMFTVRKRVVMSEEGQVPAWGKLVGAVSIVVWLSVAAFARLIMLI